MGGLQGALSLVDAPALGAVAIKSAFKKANIDQSLVDEVYMGNVLSAGVGQAPARQASLKAGLGNRVPATTINKVCASGMKAVTVGMDKIRLGKADVVIAGGMESMSRAPYLLNKARSGYRFGNSNIFDHMCVDGLQDAYDDQSMGIHAQNTANEYRLTRKAMDEYALESLNRARNAIQNGWFHEEVSPVEVDSLRKATIVTEDEQPALAKPEKIPNLRPAFVKGGTITAANASSISDGASALVLMSASKAKELQVNPLARLVGYASHALAPSDFTCAPIGAMRKLLEEHKLNPSNIDLIEINEAFAMVSMLGIQELGFKHENTNITGGACALGHPLGASGARILVTLIHNMIRTEKQRGLASICIGGGEGMACLIELL